MSKLTDQDLHLFNEGTHVRLYDRLGAHLGTQNGRDGTHFAVWAPNAERVSVIGDFNGWGKGQTPLSPAGSSGIWQGFVPGVRRGDVYKYHIESRHHGYAVDKADPYGFRQEQPPRTASMVWDLDYAWGDAAWMKDRHRANSLGAPISIYEVHLGSWRHITDAGGGHRSYNYREIAEPLAGHVNELGFTHVEFMPLTEYPFYGSWGYQVSGYFAPTNRFGSPQDLMYLVDYLHQRGIGVILDWVPAHFPSDEHGLSYFDGTHLYEHADTRKGFHPDWNSLIFNYGRNEVRAFLLSSAMFWLDKYHLDGLRVDGVASMLYLDYSREAGEWIPNEHGGRENLEAISLLRQFNETVYRHHPDVQTYAEESTAWPMVSRPTYAGGLGFGLKWDMGWMHDTLTYFEKEAIHRKYHQGDLTFRGVYAFHENFVLPLSHDEVVHGKGSLLNKMPGDDWQKLANLRLMYAYMFATPGKKLLFMGAELGQWTEWNHDRSLDWSLLDWDRHRGIFDLVKRLNELYREDPSLHQLDHDPAGFEWIDAADAQSSIIIACRKSRAPARCTVFGFNFTPVPRSDYRIGVPQPGWWDPVIDTDATRFGGSGHLSPEPIQAAEAAWHGRSYSLTIGLPPLGAIAYRLRV